MAQIVVEFFIEKNQETEHFVIVYCNYYSMYLSRPIEKQIKIKLTSAFFKIKFIFECMSQ
jgi:hypothetical protein